MSSVTKIAYIETLKYLYMLGAVSSGAPETHDSNSGSVPSYGMSCFVVRYLHVDASASLLQASRCLLFKYAKRQGVHWICSYH